MPNQRFRLQAAWVWRRMKTLYEQLGVTPMASQTAIQQSFFRLVKKVDPAHAPHPGAEHARAEYTARRTLTARSQVASPVRITTTACSNNHPARLQKETPGRWCGMSVDFASEGSCA